jgi:acylphosphatase
MSEKARVSIIINGQVQGVFFRYKTQQEAHKLSLTGWVKNNGDGSVACMAEGEKDKLEELINWCKKGPDGAEVENVEINWGPYRGEFKGFEIR